LPVAMQFDSFILRDDFHIVYTHKIYRLSAGMCFKHVHESTITSMGDARKPALVCTYKVLYRVLWVYGEFVL